MDCIQPIPYTHLQKMDVILFMAALSLQWTIFSPEMHYCGKPDSAKSSAEKYKDYTVF